MAVIPGQWYTDGPTQFHRWFVKSDDNGTEYMVAKCWGDGDGDDESTARLIAAAPDLLAALRLVKAELIDQYEENYPDDESDNDVTEAIDAAIAAIAKAEGRGE